MELEQGRGQILSGIPFHSGNTPASSVDSRLNLDVLVWEGRVGRGHQPTHSCFGEILEKPKAHGHFSLHRDTGKAPVRDEGGRGKVMSCTAWVWVMLETLPGASGNTNP